MSPHAAGERRLVTPVGVHRGWSAIAETMEECFTIGEWWVMVHGISGQSGIRGNAASRRAGFAWREHPTRLAGKPNLQA
jgi:hypothetical protein